MVCVHRLSGPYSVKPYRSRFSEFREGFAFLVCKHTWASCVDARIMHWAAWTRQRLTAARSLAARWSLPLARRPGSLARAARRRSRSLPLAARSPPARSPRSPRARCRLTCLGSLTTSEVCHLCGVWLRVAVGVGCGASARRAHRHTRTLTRVRVGHLSEPP